MVSERLAGIHLGILKSLELERIKLFPKVRQRLLNEGLVANRVNLAHSAIGI